MKITAFARFKTKYGLGCEYFWFYPAQKNLGEEARSSRVHKTDDANNNLTIPAKESPPVEDPLKKVINDLKPKEPAQP